MLFNAPRGNTDVKIQLNNNNVGQAETASLISYIDRISNNTEIQTIKFLGINIDENLSFKQHINTIVSKLSQSLFIIQRSKTCYHKVP